MLVKFKLYEDKQFYPCTQGTADEVIEWLESHKNFLARSKNAHLVGKTVQFNYKKDSLSGLETKTVKVEEVSNGLIKGHDLSLPHDSDYRCYKEDKVVGRIHVFN